MNNQVQLPDFESVMAQVIVHGDLKHLTPGAKVAYYNAVCQATRLNPATRLGHRREQR